MSYLLIANWKMQLHFFQAINYCKNNKQQLISLSNNHSLILCPSFVALSHIVELLKNTPIHIGAQDCSPFNEGPFTGEVSAQSLQEIGCSYCIVGHSERRMQFNETNESVAEKVLRLLENNMIPIICIGENQLDAINSRTYSVLEEQLKPIFIELQSHHKQKTPIIIAYEPVWAIGTGVIPQQQYLIDIFSWLEHILSKNIHHNNIQLLYGGSVDNNNITSLKKISSIRGFLIGSASTDFSHFQKIIDAT